MKPPPLGTLTELVHHLRPGADPGNDADCHAVGNMVIAIRARDKQVRDKLAKAIEEVEKGCGLGALRDVVRTLEKSEVAAASPDPTADEEAEQPPDSFEQRAKCFRCGKTLAEHDRVYLDVEDVPTYRCRGGHGT